MSDCNHCGGKGYIRFVLPDPIPVAEEPQGPGLPNVIVEITAIKQPCPWCNGPIE